MACCLVCDGQIVCVFVGQGGECVECIVCVYGLG